MEEQSHRTPGPGAGETQMGHFMLLCLTSWLLQLNPSRHVLITHAKSLDFRVLKNISFRVEMFSIIVAEWHLTSAMPCAVSHQAVHYLIMTLRLAFNK